MEMKLKTTYDEKADAAYIYIDESAKVDKTIELSSDFLVDLDKDKKIIGIELLNAKKKLGLRELRSVCT